MSLTSIQVDSAVRDRLRVLADAAGTSIGGLVGELAASTLTPEELQERTQAARQVLTEQFGASLDDTAMGERAEDFWRTLEVGANAA
ncbi:hypothetical protein [Streptomyces sp. NPDC058394]|uniref:hypothetical protein n=1 Tax=Streptomyces sp. NPDC058394 TaxID=3346477 RepID=UPI0036661E70